MPLKGASTGVSTRHREGAELGGLHPRRLQGRGLPEDALGAIWPVSTEKPWNLPHLENLGNSCFCVLKLHFEKNLQWCLSIS